MHRVLYIGDLNVFTFIMQSFLTVVVIAHSRVKLIQTLHSKKCGALDIYYTSTTKTPNMSCDNFACQQI